MSTPRSLSDYPLRSHDKLRYGDTDRQGHINNAVFATLLETGRVELLYDPARPLGEPDKQFVLARVAIDLLAELTWPGTIDIGTGVRKIGRSSLTLEQALFQGDRCVARGESVIVLTDTTTRRSTPLSRAALDHLATLVLPAQPG